MHLTRDEREVLYRAVVLDLSGLDDVHKMLRCGRGDAAREDRQRFEQDWRLLDDLGWDAEDPRESFELTMPRAELEPLIRRLHEGASGCLRETAEWLAAGSPPVERVAALMSAEDVAEWRGDLHTEADDDLDLIRACEDVLKRFEIL